MSITHFKTVISTYSYVFPDFKVLSIDDRKTLESITSQFLPYSDFNLVSLLCWNANGDNAFSILNNNLVLRMKDYLNDGYLYSILGKNLKTEDVSMLSRLSKKYCLIPEDMLDYFDTTNIKVEEDRDSFDYVVNTSALAENNGGAYKNLRKNLKNFQKDFPEYEVKVLNLQDKSTLGSILKLTYDWNISKGFNSEKINEDTRSIETFAEIHPNFDTFSLGLYIKDKLVAFSLSELLQKGWAMGHFGKSDINFKNCSLFLEVETSRLLFKKGYTKINLQQDTGIPGLREQKILLHPEYFLKKYTLTFL